MAAKEKAFWAALAVYAVIGLGGWGLFALAVHDAEWQEIFAAVWWLPSGLLAWLVKYQLEQSLARR